MKLRVGSVAPSLSFANLEWFNVSAPPSLEDFRGKLVVIDFWTSCCINCIQILPCLKILETRFPDDLVVIGVHTPKFDGEKASGKVKSAVERLQISHPVVSDPGFLIWRAYAISGWPTLVLIGPDGTIVGSQYGEPDPLVFIATVGQAIDEWKSTGRLRPNALELTGPPRGRGNLHFPGAIKPLPANELGYVLADTGNNQIVVLKGASVIRYGSGEGGFADGSASVATFNKPQGVAATTEKLYVADTGNHALRQIDRNTGEIATLGGIGCRGPILGRAAPALATELASPWDVVFLRNSLVFTNAGTHQIGRLDLAQGVVELMAGSGKEAIIDGPAKYSALAQPSGLCLSSDMRSIYFADSETSAIRELVVESRLIRTLIGTGLFDFGHANGPLELASLQHPLAIVSFGDQIAVADSYNDRVRIIDLRKRAIADLDGGDFICQDDICIPLSEPAGITTSDGSLILVSDTNNHRIIEFDTRKKTYRTWFR